MLKERTERRTMPYNPEPHNVRMLDRAYEQIESEPHKVSARFVFYRLWQDGTFGDIQPVLTAEGTVKTSAKKLAYMRFISKTAEARMRNYKEWRPWTMTDDLNPVTDIYLGSGSPHTTPDTLANTYLERIKNPFINIPHFYFQKMYVAICYEAHAMTSQFKYYTSGVALIPCGGQSSIPMRYEIAQLLLRESGLYGIPATLLYFGDLDEAGIKNIYRSLEDDINYYCSGKDVEIIRVGITEEQVLKYDIPDNPIKPGTYQWEALSTEQAGEIIKGAVDNLLDPEATERKSELEAAIEIEAKEIIIESIQEPDFFEE